MKNENITWSFLFAVVFAASFFVLAFSCDGIDDLQAEQDQYCEMVALWNADAKRGVSPEQRIGWPPYKGEEQCRK